MASSAFSLLIFISSVALNYFFAMTGRNKLDVSISYAMPVWDGVNQTELFKTLERHHCRAAKIIFGFSPDILTVHVYKGYHGMLPRTSAQEVDCLRQQIFFKTAVWAYSS